MEQSTAEQRLAERGVPIEQEDFPPQSDPEHDGFALIGEVDGGIVVRLIIRSDQDDWSRAMFAEWAESRVDRFLEHGPEPDGWHKRSDGNWQLWTRTAYLGGLGEPDGP